MGFGDGEGAARRTLGMREEESGPPGDWGEGAKSFATDTAGKPAFALKTAHQERTYAMFREHDGLIGADSFQISAFHAGLFVLLAVVLATYANVFVSFALFKNQVSVAQDEVYAELLGMRNITVTLHRLQMLSQNTLDYEARSLYTPSMLVPAYHRRVVSAVFHINTRLIMGLEYIRSYDQDIRTATSCITHTQDPKQQRLSNCAIEQLAANLHSISPKHEEALLQALLKTKLPLAETLDSKMLELYPSSWVAVTEPAQFIHRLTTQGAFKEILLLSNEYVDKLQQILRDLHAKDIWMPTIITTAVFGGAALCLLIIFAIVIGIKSQRIYEASSVCQSAVFSSGKSIQSKMKDLSVFFVAYLESLLLPQVRGFGGLAALLLGSNRLTGYQHKLLKLQEKAAIDILTTAINLIIYIETEVLVKNEEGSSVDLRAAVERSIELFRPKAAANKIPISCTFANGCPSMALIDQDKLSTTLTRTLAYVIDHSVEKGMGIDVYVNANTSSQRQSKEAKDPSGLQMYDVRFEVKGRGVCMENTKAQMMVQTKGLIDRGGQGLRLLTCSRIAQSLGGFMQLQSSPSRGTFISFIFRRRGRFSLQDVDDRFSALGELSAKVLTLSLSLESKQFFTFLCKDIGITCTNCFCLRQLVEELKQDDPDCPVLAVFLGDSVKSSANPSDRNSRALSPREVFAKLLLHAAENNKGVKFAFVSSGSRHQTSSDTAETRISRVPTTPSKSIRASTLVQQVIYRQLELPLKTSDVIDVIVLAMQERMQQKEERARAKSKLKVSYMMDVQKDSDDYSESFSEEDLPQQQQQQQEQQQQERLRSPSVKGPSGRNRSTLGGNLAQETPKGRGSRVTQAFPQANIKLDAPSNEESSDSESESESVELNDLEDEYMDKAFCARDTIPESLRGDVNAVVDIINETGLCRPAHELVDALLERVRERPLSASRRLASLVDVSLELEEYYREMPGQRLIEKELQEARSNSAGEIDSEEQEEGEEDKESTEDANGTTEAKTKQPPLAYTQSAPPPKQRRDPIWWMGSTASLKVRIPPNHVIQSQFNLASVSSFDVKAYTMHDLLDWDFHVLALPEPEAVRLCRDLLVYYADRAALGIRGEVIMNFCGALHANYLPNPYHNFYHALNVVQVLCLLLALPDVGARFSPTDYFVLSVAALGHDLGHPGFNNLFMQRNQTWVARIYSNTSILENYHAASLLQILRVPHMDLFSTVSDTELKTIRQRLINAIMWTDMAKHFDMVAKLDGKIQGEMVLSEGIMCTLQKPYLEGLLLHSADISNPLLNFDMCRDWAIRACDEFYNQNKLEEALGQPPFNPALQSFDEFCVAKSQIGFIDFICKPLFNNLALMFPAQLGERAAQMRKNRQRWKHLADRNLPPKDTPR